MRIAFYACTAIILGCNGLSAQPPGPAEPPTQQTGPVHSPSQAAPPAPTPSAPLPAGASQPGNASVFQIAPPGVEEALRARMALFYQCQVDSAFRRAEQYVAEDSKDKYYNSRHQKYFNYKVVQIKFSEDFAQAEAMVVADIDLHFQGTVFRAPMPLNSYWKMENGQWCWYVHMYKAGEVQHTPFGDVVTKDPKDVKPEQPGDQTEIGKRFVDPAVALKRFGHSPTLSKAIALLTPDGKYQDQIVFENTTKIPFKFHIREDIPPGFTVTPTSGELKPNEGVVLKVSYKQAGSGTPAPLFKPCGITYGDEGLNMTFYLKVTDK
jgi:hypothetical protein